MCVSVCVPTCAQSVDVVDRRPQGTRCQREKQLRERETAACAVVYQRWSQYWTVSLMIVRFD